MNSINAMFKRNGQLENEHLIDIFPTNGEVELWFKTLNCPLIQNKNILLLSHILGPTAGAISKRLTPRYTVIVSGLLSALGLVFGSVSSHVYMFAVSIMLSGKKLFFSCIKSKIRWSEQGLKWILWDRRFFFKLLSFVFYYHHIFSLSFNQLIITIIPALYSDTILQ